MWKSLNWVVISSEKELEVTTRRFDQYVLLFIIHSCDMYYSQMQSVVKFPKEVYSPNEALWEDVDKNTRDQLNKIIITNKSWGRY